METLPEPYHAAAHVSTHLTAGGSRPGGTWFPLDLLPAEGYLAAEVIDSYRDLVANTLDAYLASISNRLGQVMKQLTVIATIFMPLSFLTGFFGMNFAGIRYDRSWLCWIVLAMTLALPVAMLMLFARSGRLTDDRRIMSWARLRGRLRRRR